MKRALDNLHLVGDSPMLMPDIDVEIIYEDIDTGDYDESGFYHRMIKRFDKRTWKFKYAALTAEEFAYLRSLIKNKASFPFTFYNEDNEKESVLAFCKPVSIVYQSKRSGLYKNLIIEIVEC